MGNVELTHSEREALEWGMSKNSSLLNALLPQEPSLEQVMHAKEVAHILTTARRYSVSGVQEKLREAGSSEHKLGPLMSELKFAVALAELDATVHVIADNDPSWTRKSPDLDVVLAERRLLVEVAQISYDATFDKIRKGLTEVLSDKPVKVLLHRGANLAKPAIQGEERGNREVTIDEFVNPLKKMIERVTINELPVEVEIKGTTVTLERSEWSHGYLAGGSTDAFFPPRDSYESQFKMVLSKKAKKREDWTEQQKSSSYLVAIDSQPSFFGSHAVRSLLYGPLTHDPYPDGEAREESHALLDSPELKQALANGWRELLHQVGFKRGTDTIVTESGIFLRNGLPFQNLAGVLCRFSEGYRFFPNPVGDNAEVTLTEMIPWGIESDYGI